MSDLLEVAIPYAPPALALLCSMVSLPSLRSRKLRDLDLGDGGQTQEIERTYDMLNAVTRTARIILFNAAYLDLNLLRASSSVAVGWSLSTTLTILFVYHAGLGVFSFWLWNTAQRMNYATYQPRRGRGVSNKTILWIVSIVGTVLPIALQAMI